MPGRTTRDHALRLAPETLRSQLVGDLRQTRRLGQAAANGPAGRERAIRDFLRHFDCETLPRLRRTERALLPMMMSGGPAGDAISAALVDYERLQVLVRRLAEELDGRPQDPELLLAIGALVRRVVRRERREILPLLEGVPSALQRWRTPLVA
jgi:hypothetical protein